MLITIIMVGFAALTWGPALFARAGTGLGGTSINFPSIFIPVWLTLTIGTVIISMWFTKRLMEYEKDRDYETAPQGAPAPSH